MTMAADKQDKVLNVPTLRFPEFDGEWYKDRIRNLFTMNVGGDIDKANVSKIQTDEFKYPVIANALSDDGIYGYTSEYKDDSPCITVTGRGDVGCAKYRDYPLFPIVRLLVLHSKGKIDCRFGEHAINSIKKYEESTGVPQLTAPQLGAYSISFPNLTEQAKIGAFLKLIDERISTQNRIIEELKMFRDTLMFKLLSPRKNWEHVCIHDIAMVVGGGTPDTNVKEYWDGNIQWFTPSEIGKEKYAIVSERTISQAGLDNSSAKLLPANTILLSTRATIGECSIAKKECCTNQGFQSLIATKVTPEFLYYLIQTKKRDLLSKASGSTFSEISANEVRKIHICIPTTAKEQEALVQPLSAYDEKIETECKILYLYKLQKQFLLSKLFI